MNLRTSINLIRGTYHAQVGSNATYGCGLSAREEEAIAQFGEPVITCGGEFSGSEDGTIFNFELPANDRSFPSMFPIVETFEEGAEARIFVSEITRRIQAALAELCSRDPGAIGSSVVAMSTSGRVEAQPDGDVAALFLQATGTSNYF